MPEALRVLRKVREWTGDPGDDARFRRIAAKKPPPAVVQQAMAFFPVCI